MYVSESDSSSATRVDTITITGQANQKQDVATLNRDTSNLNGTVSKTPDLQNVLNKQSDLMNAATAASETIAKQIGNYADKKEQAARDAAAATDDPALKAQYMQDAKNWAEGDDNRVALHIAGGALTGGLTAGGWGAAGGAAGAGVSAKVAPELTEIAQSIKDAGLTGNKDVDELLGNVTSNLLAGGAGALAGGGTGALTSAAVDRFNRQLHQEEKTLAKQLADRSGGKYTQAQIEDQMRVMGISVNGASESGAPATLVGQMPTDSGARWISGGTTADGKPILTQITAQANPELQSYILANYNIASPGGVPSQFTYALTGGGGSYNITGPFTKFDQSDVNSIRSTSSSLASATSLTAGWIASSASTFAAAPSPYARAFGTVALVATATGVAADGVSQLVSPNIGGI